VNQPIEGFLNQHLYVGVITGVLLSVTLPLLRALLPRPSNALASPDLWAQLRPFVVIACFSLLTAILVIAFAGDAVHSWKWHQALLAGYAWDSTLQKVSKHG